MQVSFGRLKISRRPNWDSRSNNLGHIDLYPCARSSEAVGERGPLAGVASMDNVERSFAAVVATGLVVLVVGIVLLAVM